MLGDAVVDAGIGPLREKLVALNGRLSATSQQLKYVTVLFTDVADSTQLSQHLDAEDMYAVMNGVLHRLATVIERFGGRVLSLMGDGLAAAFGAEASREDDPEQAVRAGLALLDEAKVYGQEIAQRFGIEGFAIRVGINTGQVLVGSGSEVDNTVIGRSVNLAARMEQAAPVGGIRISHDTYRHVRGVFDVAAEPPLQVKGSTEPIRTYLVHRAKPRAFRVMAQGIEGIETRMLGREAELKQL